MHKKPIHAPRIYAFIVMILISGWSLKIDSYNGNTNIDSHNVNIGDSKDKVIEKIGNPTSHSRNPQKNTWYYIYTHAKHMSLIYPKYLASNTLTLDFDQENKVQKIQIAKNNSRTPILFTPTIEGSGAFSLKRVLSSLRLSGNQD